MIICSRCGTKNNDNFNCCYNCGAPLNKNSEPANEYKDEESIIAPIPDETDVELSDSYEVNDNSLSEFNTG